MRAGSLDRQDLLAATLSAVFLNLAGPPGLGPVSLIALVPLLLRWARCRRVSSLLWSARYGALFFGIFWAIELLWVLRIVRVATWPLMAWAGQVLALALIGALFGAALYGARRFPLVFGAPLVWAGIEVVRADLIGPLRFGWSPLALTVVDTPVLIQAAAWIGEAGVGVLIVAVNALVAAALYRSTDLLAGETGAGDPEMSGSARSRLLLAGALLAVWAGSGAWRLNAVDPQLAGTIVAVQPAVPLQMKRDTLRAEAASIAAIEDLLPAAVAAGVGEIVLPETALPMNLDAPAAMARLEGWARQVGRPIWVGGFAMAKNGGILNVLSRVTPTGMTGRWAKVALVPGVESGWGSRYRRGAIDQLPVPYGDVGEPRGESLGAVGNASGSVPGGTAGVLICIESVRESLARRHAQNGANWLLNVTNDSWLAEEGSWTQTLAFETHPAHMQLRSVETGLGSVRVGNNGWTGTISPTGTRTLGLPPHTAGVASLRVYSLEGMTPFVRYGWHLRWMVFMALLGFLTLAARRGAVDPP